MDVHDREGARQNGPRLPETGRQARPARQPIITTVSRKWVDCRGIWYGGEVILVPRGVPCRATGKIPFARSVRMSARRRPASASLSVPPPRKSSAPERFRAMLAIADGASYTAAAFHVGRRHNE